MSARIKSILALAFCLCVSMGLKPASTLAKTNKTDLSFSSRIVLSYDPFSGLSASETLQVKVSSRQRDDASNSSYQLLIKSLEPGGAFYASNKRKQKIPILFRNGQSAAGFKNTNGIFQQNFNLGSGRSASRILRFDLAINESIFADAGSYFMSLSMDLLELPSGNILARDQLVEVEVKVKKRLQMNLAGTRSNFARGSKFSVVDFDILESGESKKIFLQARGNTNAIITLSSENNGALVHAKFKDSRIAYGVNVDGVQTDLRAPRTIRRKIARNFNGSSYPINFTIGEVSGAFAGVYKDIVIVEVRPQ